MTDAQGERQEAKRLPFTFDEAVDEVTARFATKLAVSLQAKRKNNIPAENILAYIHGQSWRSHDSYKPDEISEMSTFSNELVLPFDIVVSGDLTKMVNKFTGLIDDMHDSLIKYLYQILSQTCEAEGQTVRRTPTESLADAFVRMVEKVEFSVDRQGRVSRPQIHVGVGAAEQMEKALSGASPELSLKLNQLIEQKEKAAIQKERERKAKFVISNHE